MTYDREQIKKNTKLNPTWLHFGAGNIFRAFPAAILDSLLEKGKCNTGLIVAEGFDYEIIEKVYTPFDNISMLVTLKPDGDATQRLIGSVVESLIVNPTHTDWTRLVNIFENPSLQMVSLTITEKGYSSFEPDGIMSKITALCYKRYQKGAAPLSLVSMDNCSHNGILLHSAVSAIAQNWIEDGSAERGFLDYINDPSRLAFPCTMIDKITPRPDARIQEYLRQSGYEHTDIIITAKNTYTAAFVNAEEPQYLVIEDLFPNGRPDIDREGVVFTDAATVDMVEKMKVCTCLNPLHTALAVFGCLLSHTLISDEMRDTDLKELVYKLGYSEGMPVVVDPGIVSPSDFIKEVLEIRLPNPFMPDTPQRIATDTSQKLSIRFGETIKAYIANPDLNVLDLECIPLVFAGWCRYLMGIDDNGGVFAPSPDPLLDSLQDFVNGINIGNANAALESPTTDDATLDGNALDSSRYTDKLRPILSNKDIFGVDLYKTGLAAKVERYFEQMVSGKGGVRAAIRTAIKSAKSL